VNTRRLEGDPGANDSDHPGSWKFALTLGVAELRRGDAVSTLLDVLVILPGARHHTRQLCLILTELFSNALDHGLLRLDANCKARAEGLDAYLKMKAQALQALEHGTIAIALEVDSSGSQPVLQITMRDSGAGFDHRAGAPRGRGLALISALCSAVEYRGSGNEVRVSYALAAPQVERLAPHGLSSSSARVPCMRACRLI
jgi:anti-sigma regulatory factor (Ser/Thr protein kinase)